jgi:hypothetical protein
VVAQESETYTSPSKEERAQASDYIFDPANQPSRYGSVDDSTGNGKGKGSQGSLEPPGVGGGQGVLDPTSPAWRPSIDPRSPKWRSLGRNNEEDNGED